MRKRGLYYKLLESQQQSSTPIDIESRPKDHEDQLDYIQNADSNTRLPELETDIIPNSSNVNNQQDKFQNKLKEADISNWMLLRLNQPEWKYIALGVIGSVIMGLSAPIYGIIFGQLLGLLDQPLKEDVQHLNNILSLVFSI